MFARYATACLNRRTKVRYLLARRLVTLLSLICCVAWCQSSSSRAQDRRLQKLERRLTNADLNDDGLVSGSQLSEMQERLEALETQVEDERDRANALQRTVEGLPQVVTGLGAVVEQLSEGREDSRFTAWRVTFEGWHQSLLNAATLTGAVVGAKGMRRMMEANHNVKLEPIKL